MTKYFELIERSDSNRQYRSATVVGGDNTGEKILLENGTVIFSSGSFLPEHTEEIMNAGNSSLAVIDGRPVYIEIAGSENRMVICGAGHVAMPIIKIAKLVGFHVTVIDDRKEFTDKALAAGADVVITGEFEAALDTIEGNEHTFFVVVTRGHSYDTNCLRSILKKNYAYLGAMGSSRRIAIVKQDLINEGFPEEQVNAMYSPIGLKIKSDTPEEIAVSILAEIIMVKNSHKDIIFPRPILDRILGSHHQEKMAGHRMLCTIVEKQGAAPREVGSRMLYSDQGEQTGTIGGGLMEHLVKKKADEMFAQGIHYSLSHFSLSADAASKEGEVCGGDIDVFLEEV
ncbi:MAG: XdhC family protein [Solobacterium sp.]|nr:XdhC family protein [Solobacterium sp.]